MRFIRTILSYLISFIIIAVAANYFDPSIQSEINTYFNPTTNQLQTPHQQTHQNTTPSSNNHQDANLPSINDPQESHQEHWKKRNLTIYIQTTDPTAKKDFIDAINDWNDAKVLKLSLIKNPKQTDIICDIQDLSANTKHEGLETLKTLGNTEVSYDQNTGEIMHANSVIDIYQIQNMPHDQQVWIAEHELGHAFGLSHTDPGSHTVMEPQNLKTGITSTDINNLKKIYP